jgi:hypothetical protein
MFIFYNAAVSKKHFILDKVIIIFTKHIKMWMIHLDMLEIFILQLKNNQYDVLEQDTELCPFCYFPATTAG